MGKLINAPSQGKKIIQWSDRSIDERRDKRTLRISQDPRIQNFQLIFLHLPFYWIEKSRNVFVYLSIYSSLKDFHFSSFMLTWHFWNTMIYEHGHFWQIYKFSHNSAGKQYRNLLNSLTDYFNPLTDEFL